MIYQSSGDDWNNELSGEYNVHFNAGYSKVLIPMYEAVSFYLI